MSLTFRVDEFVKRISADPSDCQHWQTLIKEINPTCPIECVEKLRKVFDMLIEKFPASPKHWHMYIEFESGLKNFKRISELFASSLRNFSSFDLYSAYLNYIRSTYNNFDDPQSRDVLRQAFKFVLTHVEHDINSGLVFAEYIVFLKSAQVNSPFEEQKKIEEIRSVYQRSVCLPVSNVKSLWRDWETFENGIDKSKAKAILSEKSAAYILAHATYSTLKSYHEDIERVLRIEYPPLFDCQDSIKKWRRIIQFERSNPLKLKDSGMLFQRISYTFWQVLFYFPRMPEFWYEFASMHFDDAEKAADALKIIRFGVAMCPGSFLLNLGLADLLATRKESEKGRDVYEQLILYWESHFTLQQPVYDRLLSIAEAKQCLSKSWVFYLCYAAREYDAAEHRALFKRARAKEYWTWHVAATSALLEYHRTKSATVAKKIFKYAVDTFPDEIEPVLLYADYLQWTNDGGLPQVLESGLQAFGPQTGLSERLARHQLIAGTDASMASLEFARRKYTFLNLDLVSSLDLGINTVFCKSQEPVPTGTKRRILDEWMAPEDVPIPDILAGWSAFRLPKMPEEDAPKLNNLARSLYEPFIRKSRKTDAPIVAQLQEIAQQLGNTYTGPVFDIDGVLDLLRNLPRKKRHSSESTIRSSKRHR